MKVEVCSGCLGEIDVTEFIQAVEKELQLLKPNIPWKVSTTKCQRFCPPQRVTWIFQNKLGMSSGLSPQDLARSIAQRPHVC